MELHGGNIYKIVRELNTRREDLIDFSSNINPLGFSPKLKDAIVNSLDNVINYPDPEYHDLRSAIAAYAGTAPDNVLVGNGATELIYLTARALSPESSLVVAPAFTEYALGLRQAGSGTEYFKLDPGNKFFPDVNRLKGELRRGYSLLVLCNPNNPTGTFLEKNIIDDIISSANEHGTIVMIDESFVEFVDPSLSRHTDYMYAKHKNAFILRSLTKFFAIPGLRLGYAVCYNESLIGSIRKKQEPWTVNLIAETAARVLLSDADYICKTAETVNKERDFLFKGLNGTGWLRAYKTRANFFLVEILNGLTSSGLRSALLKHGLLIRDASNFKFLDNTFVRIAVKDRKSNEMLLKRLGEMAKQ